MTRADSVFVPRSAFDAFLFAPIGEDGNDMPLSVLSVLARLDIDPWQEAAKLALLPGEIAATRLASLIAALPQSVLAPLDLAALATRLIALLPHAAGTNGTLPASLRRVGATAKSRTILYGIFIGVAVVLAAEFIVANHQSATLDDRHSPAFGTVAPGKSAPGSTRPVDPAPAPRSN